MLVGIILAEGHSQTKGSLLAIMSWGEEAFLQATAAKMQRTEITPRFAILGSKFP
jgi:hypothetical protein